MQNANIVSPQLEMYKLASIVKKSKLLIEF